VTPETKDRILLNLSLLPKKATTWVMGLASTAAGFWLYIPEDTKKAILEHSPLPIWAYPLVGLAVGYIASTWPQKATEPVKLADKLADKAAVREEKLASKAFATTVSDKLHGSPDAP
jgi:hypothetical protein